MLIFNMHSDNFSHLSMWNFYSWNIIESNLLVHSSDHWFVVICRILTIKWLLQCVCIVTWASFKTTHGIIFSSCPVNVESTGALPPEELFIEANSEHTKLFSTGFQNLKTVLRRIDEVIVEITDKEWIRLNWGLKASGEVKFTHLRQNFPRILRSLTNICKNYFDFL